MSLSLIGGAAVVLTAAVGQGATPPRADPAFAAAMTWVDALKRDDAAAVLEATALPFTHGSTGLKPKCERSAKTGEDVAHWTECLQHSNDLLLGELRAGDDVTIEPYRGPPMKKFAKLEKGLPGGEWTTGFLNGDGVTFTLRFLIVKGPDGVQRVGAFLVKASFERG